MISGVGPLLYILTQALVDTLPSLPPMAPHSELSLSILDGHTRAVLLCTLVPPVVLSSPLPTVANSPWALLLASFVRLRASRWFDRAGYADGESLPFFPHARP